MRSFDDYPAIFIVATVMWIIHGFILDIVVIGVLPFLSEAASDAQRADKFPWALGGYKDYERVPNKAPTHVSLISPFERVPNKAPTHRRFIAENAAYAVMRLAPVFFIDNPAVLLIAVLSYFIEGVTIAWEISTYSAPANSMLPQTLMGVFSTIVTVAASTEKDDFLLPIEDKDDIVTTIQVFCGLTWLCWVVGLYGTIQNKKVAGGSIVQ